MTSCVHQMYLSATLSFTPAEMNNIPPCCRCEALNSSNASLSSPPANHESRVNLHFSAHRALDGRCRQQWRLKQVCLWLWCMNGHWTLTLLLSCVSHSYDWFIHLCSRDSLLPRWAWFSLWPLKKRDEAVKTLVPEECSVPNTATWTTHINVIVNNEVNFIQPSANQQP